MTPTSSSARWASGPTSTWLDGTGIDTSDGVLCDESLRVLDTNGSAVDGVVACGSIARWPNPRGNGKPQKVGQWIAAQEQGIGAARTLLAGGRPVPAVSILPRFWTHQGGLRIEVCGEVDPKADIEVHELRPGKKDPAKAGVLATYTRKGKLIGSVAVNAPRLFTNTARMMRLDEPSVTVLPPLPAPVSPGVGPLEAPPQRLALGAAPEPHRRTPQRALPALPSSAGPDPAYGPGPEPTTAGLRRLRPGRLRPAPTTAPATRRRTTAPATTRCTTAAAYDAGYGRRRATAPSYGQGYGQAGYEQGYGQPRLRAGLRPGALRPRLRRALRQRRSRRHLRARHRRHRQLPGAGRRVRPAARRAAPARAGVPVRQDARLRHAPRLANGPAAGSGYGPTSGPGFGAGGYPGSAYGTPGYSQPRTATRTPAGRPLHVPEQPTSAAQAIARASATGAGYDRRASYGQRRLRPQRLRAGGYEQAGYGQRPRQRLRPGWLRARRLRPRRPRARRLRPGRPRARRLRPGRL